MLFGLGLFTLNFGIICWSSPFIWSYGVYLYFWIEFIEWSQSYGLSRIMLLWFGAMFPLGCLRLRSLCRLRSGCDLCLIYWFPLISFWFKMLLFKRLNMPSWSWLLTTSLIWPSSSSPELLICSKSYYLSDWLLPQLCLLDCRISSSSSIELRLWCAFCWSYYTMR